MDSRPNLDFSTGMPADPQTGEIKSPWLHELTWLQINQYLKTDDIVLLPVGATEQHGPHTPLMVDTGWAVAIADRVGREAKVLVAPPLHYGWSTHHLAYPGAITLRPETLTAVIVDIAQSLMVHGFRKFVLVNGNRIANLPPMEIAAAKLRYQFGAISAVVDVGLVARRELSEICGTSPGAQAHAGDSETSFMLHAFPSMVDLAAAPEWQPSDNSPAQFDSWVAAIEPPFDANCVLQRPSLSEYRSASEMQKGVGGNPRVADAQRGKRIVDAIVSNTVSFVEQIRRKTVELRNVEVPI